MGKLVQFKPYTIAMVGDNDAEINMYGEVVDSHPVDWWTGEPLPGNFIAVDDFLKDLDELGTKDNVTVHINSVGGSLYGGLAIYNRLRALSANVTTVNDGLAASAASIIFQAGNKRKVHAGSNLMIHGAAGFLFGSYKIPDLKAMIKTLDSANKTAAAAYAEATGKDAENVKQMMDKETWMTGQEAVDAGFADEVISDGAAVTMCLSPDKRFIACNGIAMSTRGISAFPSGVPTMTAEQFAAVSGFKDPANQSVSPAPQVDINKKTNGGMDMEIKNKDDLRAAFPDFVAQIEQDARNAGNAEGVASERSRIQGIEDIQAAIADADLVKNAKYGEKPLTAEQLAFQAMQAQAAIGATMLNKMQNDGKNSGVAEVSPAPAASVEQPVDEDAEAVNLLVGAIPANMKKEG